MDADHVVNECIKQLKQLPPVLAVHFEESNIRNRDFKLELKTENGDVCFDVEVKGVLKRPMPAHLTVSKHGTSRHFLVMAEYVNSAIAEDLKEIKINFIDSVGNAFFHIPEKIYAEIFGKKPELPSNKKTSAFIQPKGLQLLFLLLVDEQSLSDTYRTLSEKAGVSLDRVFAVRNELVHKGYVQTSDKKHYRFINKKGLLEQWLANYGDRMRSKLVIGNYKILPRYMNELPQRLKKLFSNHPESYALSGTLGADQLIPYYKGKTAEIFVKPALLNDLVNELKLMPAREHDVTVFNRFSDGVIFQQKKTPVSVAHPLLLYAEMLYQGGSRALEAAEMIYNQYLKQDFDES